MAGIDRVPNSQNINPKINSGINGFSLQESDATVVNTSDVVSIRPDMTSDRSETITSGDYSGEKELNNTTGTVKDQTDKKQENAADITAELRHNTATAPVILPAYIINTSMSGLMETGDIGGNGNTELWNISDDFALNDPHAQNYIISNPFTKNTPDA
jgi:hypothetical protein